MSVDEVRERLGVEIEREGFETVGGFLLSHLGRMPYVGEIGSRSTTSSSRCSKSSAGGSRKVRVTGGRSRMTDIRRGRS